MVMETPAPVPMLLHWQTPLLEQHHCGRITAPLPAMRVQGIAPAGTGIERICPATRTCRITMGSSIDGPHRIGKAHPVPPIGVPVEGGPEHQVPFVCCAGASTQS
jgi:hypothetical protein